MGRPRLPPVFKTCPVCNTEFIVSSRHKDKKCCSTECAGKAKRNKFKIKCLECGKEFEVISSRKTVAKYCSEECYYKAIPKLYSKENSPNWKKVKITCQECGIEFEVIPSHIGDNSGKFCSSECYHKYQSKIYRESNSPSWKGGKIKVICQECGTEFKVFPEALKSENGKFCSLECMYAYHGRHIRGENHPMWKGGKLKKTCEWCGNAFELYPSDIKANRKYCSNECYFKSISGENNHNWNGGSSFDPYCPKFNEEFKERVRAFFEYQCQMPGCGHIWKPGEKKLSVHHINFLKDSCCNPSIPRLFVPLCSGKCHIKTNGNRSYWEKLFTELIMTKYNGQCYLPKYQPNL